MEYMQYNYYSQPRKRTGWIKLFAAIVIIGLLIAAFFAGGEVLKEESLDCPPEKVCPKSEPCPLCPSSPSDPACPVCPPEKVCPKPETCPACPVNSLEPKCPVCPAEKECPKPEPCPLCPSSQSDPACPVCPPEKECPKPEPCPACPVNSLEPKCPVCPPEKECPAEKVCPVCPPEKVCPSCPSCPSCPDIRVGTFAYTETNDVDITGNDLYDIVMPGTVKDWMAICDRNPLCKGFNSSGWLKYHGPSTRSFASNKGTKFYAKASAKSYKSLN